MKQSTEHRRWTERVRLRKKIKKILDFRISKSSNQKSKAKEKGEVPYLMIDEATEAERARPRQRKEKKNPKADRDHEDEKQIRGCDKGNFF